MRPEEQRGHNFAEEILGVVNTYGPANFTADERDELFQALATTAMITVRAIQRRKAEGLQSPEGEG